MYFHYTAEPKQQTLKKINHELQKNTTINHIYIQVVHTRGRFEVTKISLVLMVKY